MYALLLLALLASPASSFQLAPSVRLSPRSSSSPHTTLSATSLSAIDPLRPLTSKLPWERRRREERERHEMRLEGAKLYRTLGVAEDATYEEIAEAANALTAKYATDTKRKLRIAVTKDAIMDLRLKQRVSGSLKVDSWAREISAAEVTLANKGKRSLSDVKVPAWTKGVMVMPDAPHLKSTTSYLGGTSLGCLLLPNLSTSFIMLASMCSLGLLYNRGAPDVPKDDFGQPGEVRSPNAVSVGLTVSLVFGWAAACAVIGTLIMQALPGIRRFAPGNLFVNLWINAGFWVAATFFKTYRD